MMLSLAIVILTILAIIVYIYSGPNIGFYGIFVLALVIMLYTWRRISQAPEEKAPKARAPVSRQRAGRRRKPKKRAR